MADGTTTRYWTDQDFTLLRDTVQHNVDDISTLKTGMDRLQTHMEKQTQLLGRIFIALVSSGSAALLAALTFIAEHHP